jgi:ATP-dependent Lhr-like helicase
LEQCRREVLEQQLEWSRLCRALERMQYGIVKFMHPPRVTPLAFSLMVDKLRERLSSETLTERVARMQQALETAASDKAK